MTSDADQVKATTFRFLAALLGLALLTAAASVALLSDYDGPSVVYEGF